MPRTRLPSRPAVVSSAPTNTRTYKGRTVLPDTNAMAAEIERLKRQLAGQEREEEETAEQAMAAEIERLRNQLKARQVEEEESVTIRVNRSGGMYINNGMTGFNLFIGHWEIVMKHFKEIDEWVKANSSRLTRRSSKYSR